MNIKIVINTRKAAESGEHRSIIWEGELEIIDKEEYLTMISMIADGINQPICQVPFAIGVGHYLWIPPDREWEQDESDYSEFFETAKVANDPGIRPSDDNSSDSAIHKSKRFRWPFRNGR